MAAGAWRAAHAAGARPRTLSLTSALRAAWAAGGVGGERGPGAQPRGHARQAGRDAPAPAPRQPRRLRARPPDQHPSDGLERPHARVDAPRGEGGVEDDTEELQELQQHAQHDEADVDLAAALVEQDEGREDLRGRGRVAGGAVGGTVLGGGPHAAAAAAWRAPVRACAPREGAAGRAAGPAWARSGPARGGGAGLTPSSSLRDESRRSLRDPSLSLG
jgi:hypothetical protein